jgi:hypothetical protein
MACNGVGTPRLLLNSASERFPNGLANSSGLVGKNLMFHPYALDPRLLRRADGRLSRAAHRHVEQEFYETDTSRGFVRGYTFSSRAARPGDHRDHRHGGRPHPWGDDHHAAFRRCSTTAPAWWRSAKTCPRNTTRSRSIPC